MITTVFWHARSIALFIIHLNSLVSFKITNQDVNFAERKFSSFSQENMQRLGEDCNFILFFIENHWNQNFTLFHHNKFHPKQLKTVHIHGPHHFVQQESERDFTLGLSSHEVTLLFPARAGVSYGGSTGEWSTSKFTHMGLNSSACWPLASLFLALWTSLSIGQLITWKLASLRASE